MINAPTVSVMMPCYNARESLPWALGSLLAQNFEDWELVLVDDGSTDRPEEIVEQANDPRIRLIRLPENQGRGFARQVALDNARGEFLAMLDADDWMYPARIQVELEALRAEPMLTLVSAGMAIVDQANHMVGVRATGRGTIFDPYSGVVCPVAHTPSMYRRRAVGSTAFDRDLLLGEDSDYLVRLLQDRRFLVLPDVLYAYAELGSGSALKAARAQKFARRRYARHVRRQPLSAAEAIGKSFMKELYYRGGSALGMDDRIIRRRSRPPTSAEIVHFNEARRQVEVVVDERFPGSIVSKKVPDLA